MPPNAFYATLAQSLAQGGTETTVYLSNITTLTGETITTAQFATFGRGIITVDPLVSQSIEFISFTGVDGTNIALTGATRGLSALSNSAVTANKKYHPVGAQVIISFGTHNIKDIVDYVAATVTGSIGSATDTTSGAAKTTEDLSPRPRAMVALVSQQSSPNMTLKVNPFAITTLENIVNYTGGNTPSFTAPVSNPRIDLIVYEPSSTSIKVRAGTEGASPSEPTPTSGDIVLASVYLRVGSTALYERDDSVSTHGYVKRWYQPAVYNPNVVPAGTIITSATRTTPTGYLPTDGSAYSRTAQAALFNAICPSQNCTITIASPGVVTATAHGLVAGDKIHFTTTGGLPSGLSTNTDYYVIASGITADTFKVALSPGGQAINTSGSQSGTHTLYKSAFGKGDGSTTFNVPDYRGKGLISLGQNTETLVFESNEVSVGSDTVTILDTVFPAQGQAIQLTTTGTLPTGLSLATTYYIIRASSTTIKFATSQSNANAGTAIDITGAGSGVHTITFTGRNHTVLGRVGGEETHGVSQGELAGHQHALNNVLGSGLSGGALGAGNGSGTPSMSNNTPADAQHNNMAPYMNLYTYIKT